MAPATLTIVLKSIVLLGVAALIAAALRKTSAAARHLVWTVAFAALLLLPFLSVSLPSAHFAPADRFLAPAITFSVDAITPRESAAPASSTPARPVPSRRGMPNFLVTLWVAGTLLGLVRIAGSLIGTARLRARSKPLTLAELSGAMVEMAVPRPVELREIAQDAMPMTAGWLHPAIFLPAGAAAWDREKLRAVLLHELAHVRRADLATQMLARIALAAYWWNPLASFAWREFLDARERAADDVVLACGTKASDYANHLLEFARSTATPAVAAIAMAEPSQLETRLRAILDSRLSRRAPSRLAVLIAIAAAALIVAPLAAIRAQNDAPPADVATTIRVAQSQNDFAMLDRTAEFFVKKGQYETARQLLQASLEVRGKTAGTSSTTYSDGLLKLGDLTWSHYLHGAVFDPKKYYAEAIAAGDRPEAAQALLRLGIVNMTKPAVAEGYLQRAMSVSLKGDTYAEALAWMAEIRSEQGNAVEAEALFTRARAAAPHDSLIEEMFARYLAEHDRKTEAEPLAAEAAAYRVAHIAEISPQAVDAVDAKKIGGKVMTPGVATKVEPGYAKEAAALKIQGTVTLSVVIGPDGRAGSITLKRGLGFGLDERALEAVSQWTFHPGTVDGSPVPVLATIEVNFRLL